MGGLGRQLLDDGAWRTAPAGQALSPVVEAVAKQARTTLEGEPWRRWPRKTSMGMGARRECGECVEGVEGEGPRTWPSAGA